MKKEIRRLPVVSVIIPVFNAEKYLNQCIDSLLNQTYPNFELICIDDGSTDYSYDILMRYKRQDDRITLIKQQNQYAGAARNRGLQAASGKFVLFLDADDFFCENMLEAIVEQAERKQTEILVFDAYRFDNEEQTVRQLNWKPLNSQMFGNGIKSASEIADTVFNFTVPSPWNKLFMREYILKNNLYFQNIQRSEDLFFVYAAIACARKIGILNQKLLYYRDNNACSLQGSYFHTPALFSKALFALQNFLVERDMWNQYQKSFEFMALSICVYHLSILKSKDDYCWLFEVLKRDVISRLYVNDNDPSGMLISQISSGKEVIVYGAGALAIAFVKYLIYQYEYTVDKILIAVTNTQNNPPEICGIQVRKFETVPGEYKDNCIIIAVSDEIIQDEIESIVQSSGYKKTVKLGFHGFADIIKKFC